MMMNTASTTASSSVSSPAVMAKEYNYNYEDSNNDDDDDDSMLSMTLLSNTHTQRDVEVEEDETTTSSYLSFKRKCCKCFQHKTTTFLFGVVAVAIFVLVASVFKNGEQYHHQRRRLVHAQPLQRRQLSSSIIPNHRGDTNSKEDEPPSPADLKMERLTTHWHIQSHERQKLIAANDLSDKQQWNPFFGSQVHVIQIGDKHYQSWYERQSLLNKKWSQCAGYQYTLMDWEMPQFLEGDDMGSHNCAYTTKVKMIRDYFIEHTHVGDWLIFADLDAYYQYQDCTMLEQVLAREVQKLQQEQAQQQEQQRAASASSHQRNRRENEVLVETSPHKCDVIIHATSAVGINSGVLILKHTPAVRNLLETWYNHQYETGFCRGAGDQWTLQELMLELNRKSMDTLSNHFDRQECVSKGYGPFTNSPRGPCSASKLYRERQHARTSSTSSLVAMGSNMCFFQCTADIPLQCHDCERDQDASQMVLQDGHHKATTPTLTKSICLEKPPLFHHSRGMLEHFEADA